MDHRHQKEQAGADKGAGKLKRDKVAEWGRWADENGVSKQKLAGRFNEDAKQKSKETVKEKPIEQKAAKEGLNKSRWPGFADVY